MEAIVALPNWQMLYERWLSVARDHRNEIALCELHSGRQWTFGQLREQSDAAACPARGVCYPQGLSAEFIFTVLRAWRWGRVVSPLEAGQASLEIPSLSAQIAHLKTTSATSGSSRYVALTAGQLLADAENIVRTMGLRIDWPNLAVISLAHSYGFSNLVAPLLLHGIPLILGSAPLPEVVLKAAALVPDVTLPAVPALWRAWHDSRAIPPNVRLAISAGAPLPLALEEAIFQVTGVKVHNFYGATECGGIAYDLSDRPRTDAACAGSALQGVELATTEDGALAVRGAAVAETYWPEASPSLGGGRYLTNDIAELRDGLVFLGGRTGDQINVAGRKISPESIEQVLQTHPGVRECLVFGVPSPDVGRGEAVVACVVTRSPVTQAELRQFILSKLPAWQAPRDWWFVDSLGVNQRGKISRPAWRRKYQERFTL